ncbi:hypothetical protein FY528_12960 [Hymenobacter lutimineralis]|uniref:Glycosyltransferase RgtA/B/C/D-like domain-containing protein n=1 Tax=Hymenobacter lutimineralis TaxID=2606448 RepID=A0A5D6UZ82_9BACT|nr:glycosyltransferase family 39 protein [Hymenobacter lutimineralis]TYZ08355.1 hypothetical protein FY528_12960 [Hymenobacter lutimineralis]
MKYLHTFLQTRIGRIGAVLSVCVCSFFVHLGAPEAGLMEARNFVAAREMVAGGSWLLPTMNGALRLAKPPLPTWAVAGVQMLTGPTDNLAVLRLPAASMATLLVFFFWGLARELTRRMPGEQEQPGRTAWLAALMLASSLLVITVGRDGQWDIFSNAWMVGCLWLLTRALRTGQLLLYATAGLLLAASFLSKGPVALYALLLPFVVASCTPWGLRGQVAKGWGLGVAVFVGVGALLGSLWPWYVWERVQPEVLAIARVEVASWGERHVQPVSYYLNFPVFTGVWALAALAALVVPYARGRAGRYVPYWYGLVWLVLTLIFLSIVPEKKERYMLPLIPPLVLLLAGLIRSWEQGNADSQPGSSGRVDGLLLKTWGGLLLLVCLGLPAALLVVQLPGFRPTQLAFWFVCLGAAGLGYRVVILGLIGGRATSLVAASLALQCGLLGLLMPAYAAWETRKADRSIRQMADVRKKHGGPAYSWYSLSEMQIKQVWQAGRPIRRWQPDTTQLGAKAAVLITAQRLLPTHALGQQAPGYAVALIDSFYVGRNRASEQLFVFRIQRVAK